MTAGESLVRAYFAACSRGDVAGVVASFTPDAVVWDTNHAPVRGAAAIGEFYARVREARRGATWQVDTYVGDGDAAAVEWTMLVPGEPGRGGEPGAPVAVRGSEHYAFADGRIAEIRQYWTARPDDPATGLRGFPYEEDPRFTSAERPPRA